MRIQQSMLRSYHASPKSHPLISVTFSTPTECYNNYWARAALRAFTTSCVKLISPEVRTPFNDQTREEAPVISASRH